MADKPRFEGEKQPLEKRVEYVRGVTYKAAVDLHEELNDNSYVLLRANNIQDGELRFDDVQYVDRARVKPKQLLQRGDIMICASSGSKGLVGKAALVRESMPVTFGAFCCVLRPKDNEAEYLDHYFQSRQYRRAIEEACSGSNINNLKAANFLSLVVPHYDDDSTRAISALFDSIDVQIKQAKDQLALLDSLVKSRFVEMFDASRFERCAMGDLVANIVSGTNVSGQQRPLEDGEYGVLRISAVTRGAFNSNEYKVVVNVAGINMVHPHRGDLLFSRANTSEMVGATAIVDADYDQLFLPDKLWRLDPADGVETVFLKALLSSPAVRSEMTKVSTGSSGSMQNISMAKFRKLSAFLPPLALQRQFADFVTQVDKSRFVVLNEKISRIQLISRRIAHRYSR